MEDIAVVIGRFQPFHRGHSHLIRTALDSARNVLVLIGSANAPRSLKNPWTFMERRMMLERVFSFNYLLDEDTQRIFIAALEDGDEDQWLRRVKKTALQLSRDKEIEDPKICIVGHKKDDSSYYLDSFSPWGLIAAQEYSVEAERRIDATLIRDLYFKGNLNYLSSVLPKEVYDYLLEFEKTGTFKQFKELAGA